MKKRPTLKTDVVAKAIRNGEHGEGELLAATEKFEEREWVVGGYLYVMRFYKDGRVRWIY